jgi:prephenate dehydrogenase
VRVAILGAGLIGGSIGLALKRAGTVERIIAYDRSETTARRSVERGAADAAADSPAAAVVDADIVFVATPVLSIADVVRAAVPGLRAGTILTDVGSTKSRVVNDIETFLDSGFDFVGGHPMAGTEEEGIEAAQASLFDGAWWILTPTERARPEAYRTLHGLVGSMGCQVLALTPTEHDDLMAIVSHVPHLTATGLMNLATDHGREKASLLALAAGGFRDVTRVAASNPDIWIDICLQNRDAIVEALGEFAGRLTYLQDLIARGDTDALRAQFLAAREGRRGLPGKQAAGELVEILIPVPDRPGVLAEVTTLVGALGVNIEDLQITHAEEGGRGVLRLTLLGIDQAHRVRSALSAKGYEPRSTSI